MKEMVSFHNDVEKRLGIFFGLGAFLVSSLFALFQGLAPEAFLLRGVVVLVLFSLLGWGYGVWLKATIEATKPEEEMPENMERRSRNAQTLDEGSVVVPNMEDTVVMEDPDSMNGQVVNYTLPELNPMESGPVDEPMIPSKSVARANTLEASKPAAVVDEGDLPPPPVPSWLGRNS